MSEYEGRRVLVYAWLCPDTGKPVYVGKTSATIAHRMNNHRRMARKGDASPKYRWLSDIIGCGKEPEILVLEKCSVEESARVEKIWQSLLSERFQLLNAVTAGCGNPGVGRVVWTPELLARLGKETDDAIARDIGCERGTVSYRRAVLGIPPCPDRALPSNTICLLPEVMERLGREPDYTIARDVGVSKFVISKHRRRLGISDYASSTGNTGKIKPGEKHRRWEDTPQELIAFLGTMKDADLADRFGYSRSRVAALRKERGIPSYESQCVAAGIRARKWAPRKRRKIAA